MASIVKRNNSYRVTVSNGYDINGKKIVRTKTFNKPDDMTDKKWEKEIQILALEFEREVENGLNINSNSTLKEYIEKWFKEYADKQLQPTTLESYHYWLDIIILPALGHIKLNKLTPMKILSLLNNLTEDGIRKDGKPGGYSNRIIKYQWQILSSALQQAVYWQIMPENPCKRVKVPKNINKDNEKSADVKVKYYDENQTILLLDSIKTEHIKYQIGVNIVIFCGLRVGELLGLTWNDIDFENKTLTINKSRSHTKEKGMFTKYPKNKSSIRTINIPDILVTLLQEYKVNQNSEKVICGDLWSEEWNKTPWLMTQWNGEGMYISTLTDWLLKFLKRNNKGIDSDTSKAEAEKAKYYLPVISFHKLRHTSATLLIGQNTDIRTVSARLGHAQTSTTMNIYVHGLNSLDVKAANSLEDLLIKDNSFKNAV